MKRDNEEDSYEFMNEKEIMSQLNSPYIVRVYDSIVTDKSFYLVMEYVPLGSLKTVLDNYILSPYMRCRYMFDVAKGMEYLHSQGIIHRDLKPGNVLVSSLDPNTDDALCKISDFGGSRKGMDQTKTMTMTVGVGTPYYMAPEMLRGENKYTRTIDVYSFSIMCVELWNEELPYIEIEFESQYALAEYVLQGNRPRIDDDCPHSLAELISRCWSAEVHKRPSFTDIVNDLKPIVDEVKKTMPDDDDFEFSRKREKEGNNVYSTSKVSSKSKSKSKNKDKDKDNGQKEE